ncbi:MAG: hypothetical protein ABI039_03395, partial [Vicinamibacterales bacterium]
MRRLVLIVALVALVGAGGMWYLAGSEPGPTITINSPEKFVGRSTPLKVTLESPSEIVEGTVSLEQNGKALPLTDLKSDPADGKVVMSATIGRDGLVNGPATLIVNATRKTLYGFRSVSSSSRRDLVVRLDPPRVSVVSIHHFINLGGAEFVVMRATPEDVDAGVQVGDARYPFYPGSAV